MSTQNQTVPRGFAAYGGLAGIVTPVLALAAAALTMSVDVPDEDGIRPLAEATVDHVSQLVASSWLYLLTGVGLVLFAAFLAVRWRRASGWVLPAAATLLVATAVVIFDNLLAIGVYDVIVPAVAEQDPAAGADLIAVGDALDIIILSGHRLFQGLLGLAVAMAGLAMLGGVRAPRWLGYLGIAGGAVLVVYASTRVAPLLMAGSVLFGAWAVLVGGWSLRPSRPVPATD
jgi:uncharacterized protein DUF4386